MTWPATRAAPQQGARPGGLAPTRQCASTPASRQAARARASSSWIVRSATSQAAAKCRMGTAAHWAGNPGRSPRVPAAGRSRLAAPQAIPGSRSHHEGKLAPAAARARGHGNQRLPTVAALQRPQEGPGDRERRDRPRAGRPVLVPGRDGRLTGTEAHGSYEQEQPPARHRHAPAGIAWIEEQPQHRHPRLSCSPRSSVLAAHPVDQRPLVRRGLT
jgi:hypothetical protein